MLEDAQVVESGGDLPSDSESPSSDHEDQPTRSVLGESFLQNKHQQRLNNHPGIMGKTTRSSAAGKRKAEVAKLHENDDDSDATVSGEDITKQKLEEAKMELVRLKKRQEMAESAKKGRKTKGNSTSSATMGLVWDTTKEQFFPIGKFLANEQQLLSATEWVLNRVTIEPIEGLKGAKLVEAKEEWIQLSKEKVLEAVNSNRNYIGNQMKNKFKAFVKEHGIDQVPTKEEILNAALRLNLLDKHPNLERSQFVFDFYWGVLVPIVSSHKRWGPGKRYHCLMSTGRPYGDATQQLFVTPSDEAFTVLAWENYVDWWTWKLEMEAKDSDGKASKSKKAGAKKNGKDTESDDDDDDEAPEDPNEERDPRSVTPYTTPNGGVQRFGCWNKAGRKRYRKLKDMIVKSKGIANPTYDYKGNKSLFKKVEGIELLALQRLRKANDVGVDTKKKAKPNPIARQNDVDSDHEVEWA